MDGCEALTFLLRETDTEFRAVQAAPASAPLNKLLLARIWLRSLLVIRKDAKRYRVFRYVRLSHFYHFIHGMLISHTRFCSYGFVLQEVFSSLPCELIFATSSRRYLEIELLLLDLLTCMYNASFMLY